MTLSSSLSTALSGLTAASRAAEVVSSNVANAMTPGYVRRDLALSSQTTGDIGSGVMIDGVQRMIDEGILADRRDAGAAAANAETLAGSWLRIEEAIGLPTESGSLADRINALESALVQATSRPDEVSRLDQVVAAASSLTGHVNTIAGQVQDLRMAADQDIATMVGSLNTQLTQVQDLNWEIFRMESSGQDSSSLKDQRQVLVDSISAAVPVRQVSRDGGQIALYTNGGAILLDGSAGEFGFDPTGTITADMSVETGTLSGLTLNGNPLAVGGRFDPIAGGNLSAAFSVRDEIAPEMQADLDALSRNLVERFQDPTLDPSLATGDAGLFTDSGNAFVSTDETGLAARLAVNAGVDPAQGGESWRIRDGIGAASQGYTGNATLLQAFSDRLGEASTVASGISSGQSRSLAGIASDLLSNVAANQNTAEDQQVFHLARQEALLTEQAEFGVNTDDEMQKLLLIEQAYAANARVIQTIDALMQNLMEI